jgi:hypothetical protein
MFDLLILDQQMKSLPGSEIIALSRELCSLHNIKMPQHLLVTDRSYTAINLNEQVVFKPLKVCETEQAIRKLLSN